MHEQIAAFEREKAQNIAKLGADAPLNQLARDFMRDSGKHQYTYHFTWLGRPIIQFPQDMVALQEIIWSTRPDVVLETGIAHGGSLIFSASMLELTGGNGRVIGVDIDIRAHNRAEIEKHPMAKRITMVQGSSVDPQTVAQVKQLIQPGEKVLLLLDSNHTHEHVAQELAAYAPLVKAGSYVIVYDTGIEDLPEGFFQNRSWGKGNNPKTAVHEFLQQNGRFEIDYDFQNKLLITVAPDGYLRCIKD